MSRTYRRTAYPVYKHGSSRQRRRTDRLSGSLALDGYVSGDDGENVRPGWREPVGQSRPARRYAKRVVSKARRRLGRRLTADA